MSDRDPLYKKAKKYVTSVDELDSTVRKSKDGDRDAQRNVEPAIKERDDSRKDLVETVKDG